MYLSIRESYKPTENLKSKIQKLHIYSEPIGTNANGLLPISDTITWQDVRNIWIDVVKKITPTWIQFMTSVLKYDKINITKNGKEASKILKKCSIEVRKKYPGYEFIFLVANSAAYVKAHGGTIDVTPKVVLGVGSAFLFGNIICTTRFLEENRGQLANTFTAGLSTFDKYSGENYTHILQIIIFKDIRLK
jgi:hypothetical protein